MVRENTPVKTEILLQKQGQMLTVKLVKEFQKNKKIDMIKVCFLSCLVLSNL